MTIGVFHFYAEHVGGDYLLMFYFLQAKLVLCHWGFKKYFFSLSLSFCTFQVFESFGPVELVQLPHDQVTGLCKGFAFVQVCTIFILF